MKRSLPQGCLIRLLYIPVFMILTAFSFSALKVDFFPEITFRVLFGFVCFLRDTAAGVPFDARWLPWLLGLFVAIVAIQRGVAWRVGKTEWSGSMGASLMLGLLPLLFVDSGPP